MIIIEIIDDGGSHVADALHSDGHSDASTRATWGQRLVALSKAVVPTILIFLVTGPVVGYFAIMLPVAMTATEGPLGPFEGFLSTLAFLPLGALFAYMLGYAPALATGAAVAAVDCLVDLGTYRTAVAIIIGAGVTLALFYWASDLSERPRVDMVGGASAVAASVGAFAAGVCAMIAPRRVPAWPAA